MADTAPRHARTSRCGAGIWRAGLIGVALLVQACSVVHAPLTMPLPDGRDQEVSLGASHYVVNRRERGETRPGINLRVTRINGGDMGYDDGLRAKKVVEAYCATFNRKLDPMALGRFSAPNAWVFEGDCL